MKILHICPTFTDGLSYQENYLTKYHRRLCGEVYVITSCWIYGEDGKLKKTDKEEFVNKDDVKIIRLPIKYDKPYEYRFKSFENLYENLEKISPDIIFVHGCQWVYMKEIAKYAKQFKPIVYVDNHADYSNSATSWVSKNILHRIIWKHSAKIIRPYTKRFYGVLPIRVDILTELYGIPKNECELLVMGADDDLVKKYGTDENRDRIRNQYNIAPTDFLIVTGGKIDLSKQQTLLLMEAVNKCPNTNVKLLVYGSVEEQLKSRFEALCSDRVMYVGWLKSEATYEYISASDLVVYPGRHSVLWEQTVAQGKPMVVKYWEGTTHIDIGGNVLYLYEDTQEEMDALLQTVMDEKTYSNMKISAEGTRKHDFLYSNIAKQSIRDAFSN